MTDLFQSERWRDLQFQYLLRHPDCASCGAPAATVAHVTAPDDPEFDRRFFTGPFHALCAGCAGKRDLADSAPQLVHGMLEADYHALDRVSASLLKTVHARTPAHARAQQLAPFSPTPAMQLGTLAHAAVLEPDRMGRDFVVSPGFNRRTKAGKAEAEAWEAEHAGSTVVTQDQWDTAQAIAASVRGHPDAAGLVDDGAAEVTALWTDGDTGLPMKSRLDYLRGNTIVDLKTAQDAGPAGFARAVVNFGYHLQQAVYCAAHHAATGCWPDFLFLAVETKAPYACAVYRLDDLAAQVGWESYRSALATWQQCQANEQFPGYPAGIHRLGLPAWATKLSETARYEHP